MFGNQNVLVKVERWEDAWNQFNPCFSGICLGCLRVASTRDEYACFHMSVLHGFFHLVDGLDANCSLGGQTPNQHFLVFSRFDDEAWGILMFTMLNKLVA